MLSLKKPFALSAKIIIKKQDLHLKPVLPVKIISNYCIVITSCWENEQHHCLSGIAIHPSEIQEVFIFQAVLTRQRIKSGLFSLTLPMDRATLRQFSETNNTVIKKARYGKVYQGGAIDGFKVTALDSSEVFRTKSESWSCEECRITEIPREDGTKEAQYHEDIVGACYVGRHPNLVPCGF